MTKLKRIFISTLALIMLSTMTLSLAACRDKNRLRVFLFAQSHEVAVYQEVIRMFTEKTGINVDLTVEEENYFDLLRADLIAGTAADVFYVRPGDVRSHANLNTVVNLTASGLLTENDVDDVWDDAINFFRFDGETNSVGDIYALPKDYSQYVLGFNRKLIHDNPDVMERVQPYLWDAAKHGPYAAWAGAPLTVSSPLGVLFEGNVKLPGLPGDVDADGNDIVLTFDEFGVLAYLASNRGQHGEEPLNPTYGTAFWEEMCLMAYVWGANGEFLKENSTQVNFDSEEFIKAYTGFMDLNNLWYASASGAANTGYELFSRGQLVFFPVGTWDIGYFNNFGNVLDYDLMPWPIANEYEDMSMADRQDKWAGRVDSVGYGIYSQSRRQAQALDFIKYLSLDHDIQRYLTEQGVQIPNIEEMARTEYLNNEIRDVNGNELAPRNKRMLLSIAGGAEENGRFGPTVYTYNDEWFTEFFTGANSQLWDSVNSVVHGDPNNWRTVGNQKIRDYVATYGPRSQAKLDAAIRLENEQRV